MKKEEFINLALNSELRVLTNDGSIEKIKGIIGGAYCINDFPKYGMYGDCINANLILRPLSDLTKPIEHNGEKFVPIEKIKELFIDGTEDVLSESIEAIEYFIENNFFSRMEYLPFILIQKLIEWKFNLMDESEPFINVNLLQENPYK